MSDFDYFWFRLRQSGCLCLAAVFLLTACGETGSPDAPSGSAVSGAQAGAAKKCFFSVGHLGEKDAELVSAAGAGDVRRVEQAIDAGGDVNATDALMRTALFASAFCRQPAISTLLLDRGSRPDAKDFSGMTPLHAAVIAGTDAVARVLIDKGANINIQNTAGHTPLHLAAATEQAGMIELLLERGASVQMRDRNGATAAALAADNGHPKAVAAIKQWQEKKKPVSK